MRVPLSILDLAPIARGQTAGDTFAGSVALAQLAEQLGYERIWYAEHHNMASIASSATSVLIAHVGAHTETIRLGSGGVMLPNHAPLTIAEQFGTLAAMYPGRIDLGLGRAPGSDQNTMYALRRDPNSADTFPQDVLELQGYLTGQTRVRGVQAIPGKGSNVPLYILGSSLFGAQLAAALGLPYAFASHFAPDALEAAIAAYRNEFQPSDQLDRPYLIAGVNVIAAETTASAHKQVQEIRRARAVGLFGTQRGLAVENVTDAQADELLEAGAAVHVDRMMTYTAAGTPSEVADYLDDFLRHTDADELITVHQAATVEGRLRSVSMLAAAMAGEAGARSESRPAAWPDGPLNAMTKTVEGMIEPTALLGKWRLSRWVWDARAGLSGTASGQLTLRAEEDQIAWREQGTLLWNGSRMSVSRCYWLRLGEAGWWLYFQGGRPFHSWQPGSWVLHPCGEDSYRGLVTISGPDVWETRWEVQGPVTAQLIRTQYVRVSGPIS